MPVIAELKPLSPVRPQPGVGSARLQILERRLENPSCRIDQYTVSGKPSSSSGPQWSNGFSPVASASLARWTNR